MASEIHVDDVGTRFLMTVQDGSSGVDLSAATILQVKFKKPSDLVVSRTASLLSDGSATSGVMYYDIVDELDEAGNYKLQGKVSVTAGTFYTDIHTFKVNCNL